jgi:hypothetical protein
VGLADKSLRPVASRPGGWYPLNWCADELRLLCAGFKEEMRGAGGMAFSPLALTVDLLMSGGGGGVVDFVCPFAIDGILAEMSANTKSTSVNFMVVNQPFIENESNNSVDTRTVHNAVYRPPLTWSFQDLGPIHVAFDQRWGAPTDSGKCSGDFCCKGLGIHFADRWPY